MSQKGSARMVRILNLPVAQCQILLSSVPPASQLIQRIIFGILLSHLQEDGARPLVLLLISYLFVKLPLFKRTHLPFDFL